MSIKGTADAADLRRLIGLVGMTVLAASSMLVRSPSAAAELPDPPPLRCERQDGNGKCALYATSMIQLIANPAPFHGKKVRVIGYLILEFEGNALYLHAEDAQRGLTDNGIWVEVPRGGFGAGCASHSYAVLEGTFSAAHGGHMGLWSGALEQVSRCAVY